MASSPRNYLGATGTLSLAGSLQVGTCDPCDDGLFCNGAESCGGSSCVAGAACMGICDEAADTCVECVVAADCADANVCTDETCVNGSCQVSNNTAPCDDGLFCTLTDACGGGACAGSGDPCLGENCNEGSDLCGACVVAADCESGSPCTIDSCTAGDCAVENAADGVACDGDATFCNGVEACAEAACASPGDPCDARIETCEESSQSCVSLCGNGTLDAGEVCDDSDVASDVASGDGCSDDCTIERGFDCDVSVEPSVCSEESGAGGAGAGGGPGSGGSPAGGAGTGGEGGGGSATGDDDGCSCRQASQSKAPPYVMIALAALAFFSRRRNQRHA